MNKLFILGILMGILVEPIQKQQGKPQAQQHHEAAQGNPQPSSAVGGTSSQQEPQKNQNQPDQKVWNWHEAFAPPTWSNWALVIVGIGATVAALCTLGAIRRQGQSMRYQTTHLKNSAIQSRKAANAAKLNAQAVINSERPWLDVEQIVDSTRIFDNRFFRCSNRGKTPAKLISATAQYCFVEKLGDLPVEPQYSSPIIYSESVLVIPDGTFEFYRNGVVPDDIIQRSNVKILVDESRSFLVFYGHVTYRDTLYPTAACESLHETRWCFVWLPSQRLFVRSGPAGYNDYT